MPLYRSVRSRVSYQIFRHLFVRGLIAVLLGTTVTSVAFAQTPDTEPTSRPYLDAQSFDPSIPTLEAVLGYKSGERISSPADALTYFRALAEAAPDRMRIVEYARSWEDRPLVYGIIASKENLARIDDIKGSIAQISDPRVIDNPAAEQLIADLPATAWMSYTVHGNELSGTDAALVLAYHLLAAQGSPDVDAILENTLTFIDPTQNPDGRNRFVHNYITTAGIEPSSNRIAAERNEPWPGGRTNHYLFDMNRDWVAQTQPESKGRVRALLEWRPLVVVDAHEMGTDQTYYFPPEADPINPYITQEQMELADLFGKNNAKAFDAAGLDYYTRDIFDKLFPGYGDSWPSFYGAIAMTFEQASARGMIARKSSGEVFTYRDSVFGQVTASFATLKTAAENRETLWQNYWVHSQTGLEFGETQKTKAYVIPNAPRANALAEAIFDQGLEIHAADSAFEACGGSYDAGTFVTSLAQPRSRFVKTLMDPTSPMTEDFLGEQERRRANGEREELYDVTAWSLPLSFGVDVKACRNDPTTNKNGSFSLVKEFPTGAGEIEGPRSAVGYAIDWSADGAIAFLAAALRDDLKARSSDGAFTAEGTSFAPGSLIFLNADHGRGADHLRARLLAHAEKHNVVVKALTGTYLEEGDNFGSRFVQPLIAPSIALAWDTPTAPTLAGSARYVIEQRFGYPTTPVRVADLGSKALNQFDVLILPAAYGSYADRLGASGVKSLREWVSKGGVLIGLGRAARFLGAPDNDLSALRRENRATDDEADTDEEDSATVDGVILENERDADEAIIPDTASPDATSGVFAKANVRSGHWLGAGVGNDVNVLVSGGDIYAPLKRNIGDTVVRFSKADELLSGGYLWEETRDQLAFKPYLTVEDIGDGMIITFTHDPTFRGQLNGLDPLLANAIFRAPARSRKLR